MIGSLLSASRDDFSGSSSATAEIFRKSSSPCSPEQGAQLGAKIKKKMKNKLTPMLDKLLLRKRALGRDSQRSTPEHLSDRAYAPPQRGELRGQFAGRLGRLHRSGEETFSSPSS